MRHLGGRPFVAGPHERPRRHARMAGRARRNPFRWHALKCTSTRWHGYGRARGAGSRDHGVGAHGPGVLGALLHGAPLSPERGRMRLPLHRAPRRPGHAYPRIARVLAINGIQVQIGRLSRPAGSDRLSGRHGRRRVARQRGSPAARWRRLPRSMPCAVAARTRSEPPAASAALAISRASPALPGRRTMSASRFAVPGMVARLGRRLPAPLVSLRLRRRPGAQQPSNWLSAGGTGGRSFAITVEDLGLCSRFAVRGGVFRRCGTAGLPSWSWARAWRNCWPDRGETDADTLFFQRRLRISGDTELGLIVKNWLDAAPRQPGCNGAGRPHQ